MRVLVVITAGFGHLRPSVEIADAARRRGHEVRYVVSDPGALIAGRSGLGGKGSGGIAPAELTRGHGFATDVVVPADITDLLDRLPAPTSAAAGVLRSFMTRSAAAVPFVRDRAEAWRPDVILRDVAGHDAWAVGELLDVPVATFSFAPTLEPLHREAMAGELAWFRHEVGLPLDPDQLTLESPCTIVGAPPSWFDGAELGPTTHLVQPPESAPLPGESIDGLIDLEDGRPLVYVTFGTAFNAPELFALTFEAVADLDVAVLATVGRNNDPDELPAPANVVVTRFVSQQLVLEHAAAVVAHGGYGSVMGSLRHGRPVVSLPLFPPDNRLNAGRLAALGAGVALLEDERTPAEVRAAIRAVCEEPGYRAAAQGLADEIAALPPVDDVVGILERLAEVGGPGDGITAGPTAAAARRPARPAG